MHRLAQTEEELIEHELIAREEAKAKARRFRRRVFWVGLFFGCGQAIMFRVLGSPITGFAFELGWLGAILIYTSGHIFLPSTFMEDSDPSWHLNPWQDILKNLGEGTSIAEAIALFASPKLVELLCWFLT